MEERPSFKTRLDQKIEELFGIDLRSLALFRIASGTLILIDLIGRSVYLREHYSDTGVMPRTALMLMKEEFIGWSLHYLSGRAAIEAVMFLLAAVFAILLIVGFRTRAVTCLSWIFLFSLQNRNPLVLNSGDLLFRYLLFWGMFLPLGAKWSVDSLMASSPLKIEKRAFSMATVAALSQLLLMYYFAALYKTNSVWLEDRAAVFLALHNYSYVTILGAVVGDCPAVTRLLTITTYYLEKYGPFLAFVPIYNGPFRLAAVLMFTALHFGFWCLIKVGLFSAVAISGWFFYLPSWFWDLKAVTQITSAKSITRCAERVARPFIAFSKILDLPPARVNVHSGVIQNIIVSVFLYIVVFINYQPFFPPTLPVPDAVTNIVYTAGLPQRWNMFTPYPRAFDTWYVAPATLENGTTIDLQNNGSEVSMDRPVVPTLRVTNKYWREYMMHLATENKPVFTGSYLAFLCREWNMSHHKGDRVSKVDLLMVKEFTWYRGSEQKRKIELLGSQRCFRDAKAGPGKRS